MDASVDFLLQNLKELVVYHIKLISGAKQDLELLKDDLDDLKAILKDASKKLTKHETFKTWEKQIRETVYDVEDTIDTCITKIAAEKAKKQNQFRKLFPKKSSIDLAEEVRNLREKKVKPLFDKVSFANLSIPDVPDKTTQEETRRIRQKIRQNNIVGFDDEANTIIEHLNAETDQLQVISIIGMPGLGKTTLAWKITQDPLIKFEYPVLIWVNVSEDLHMEDVLKTILKRFTSNVPANATIQDLTQAVRDYLSSGKFLIVMDDVWTAYAWNEIRACLPTENKSGRVLITSRHRAVGTHANTRKEPHDLRFLTKSESWQLLQYEVYGQLDIFPKELETVGLSIASDCDGLPLSIVVIGGILVDKISTSSGSITTLKKEWLEISKSVKSYLVGKDNNNNALEKIISLSYEKLPYDLRNCFLYLGMFPEDAEIPVKKLERLWIAEGFVQPRADKSLEQVAEDNIKELVNRNLLMVRKTKPGGVVKTCQVHDTIREFCKKEAAVDEQNLFQEVHKTELGHFFPSPEIIEKSRRLCIHSYVHEFFKGRTHLAVARSFLCFHKSPISLTLSDISPVTDGFALLRVFEAESLRFPRLPPKLLQLMHLRYLTLAVGHELKSLPEILSTLWNLQTLILIVSSPKLEIEADIWKMWQLRHLKTKASIILKKDGDGQRGEHLQMLSRLSPESCTEKVFSKAKNLITLGIQGDLSKPMESRCLEKLGILNKLKLVHVVDQGVASEKPMPYLPEYNRFPPKLKILVLSSTYLDWGQVSMLAMLVSLEQLKLKKNACNGNSWEVRFGFNTLELLHIEKSDLIEWTATPDAFPKLKFLVIKNCERLQKIPVDVGAKLEMMYIERVTPEAVSCARAIDAARQKEGCLKGGGAFKLEIAPADKQQIC